MQMLAASVNSQEVLAAGNGLIENKSLQGTQVDDAARKLGFGAATIALLHFPDVVDIPCGTPFCPASLMGWNLCFL